jgi:cytochrome c-type biogenesis protein CcmH
MTLVAFWGALALLVVGALWFVLPPLLRPPGGSVAGPSPLAVYREQAAQLDADLAAGRVTAQQHQEALAELHCRVVDEVGDPGAAGASAPAPPARRPRLASVLAVALFVPAGTLALYGMLGTRAALTAGDPAAAAAAPAGRQAPHTMSREQMEAMVEGLAERLKQRPDDADGWHMLARSYVAFGRLPEAAQAYDRAAALAPRDPQVLADYADTLAMVNGRSLEGRPTELVAAALAIDPKHPKSLALAGTAAFNRHDYEGAIALWQALQTGLAPESEQARSIATSIAQAKAAAQGRERSPAAAAPVAGPAPTAGPTAAATATAAAPSIEGSVAISDAVKARLAGGDTLFVFARAVDGARVPLAVARAAAGEFPSRFRLDDSLSMSPQFKLSAHSEVMLGARVSRSGNATPQSGDLVGALGPVKVGARDARIVIDRVVP